MVLAKEFKFDPYMRNSDDIEICTRMAKKGHKFAISDAICQEIGFDNFSSVVERWTRYGRGDCLFYCTAAPAWGIMRKLKSYAHPFVHDFWVPLKRMKLSEYGALPFLVYIVLLRYYGWAVTAIREWQKKDENKK